MRSQSVQIFHLHMTRLPHRSHTLTDIPLRRASLYLAYRSYLRMSPSRQRIKNSSTALSTWCPLSSEPNIPLVQSSYQSIIASGSRVRSASISSVRFHSFHSSPRNRSSCGRKRPAIDVTNVSLPLYLNSYHHSPSTMCETYHQCMN